VGTPGAMLALVIQNKVERAELTCLVDRPNFRALKAVQDERGTPYVRLYVYSYESLATILREFNTLDAIRHFPHAGTIYNPKPLPLGAEDPAMSEFQQAHAAHFNPQQRKVLEKVAKMQ
jgi:hypothetical protein